MEGSTPCPILTVTLTASYVGGTPASAVMEEENEAP